MSMEHTLIILLFYETFYEKLKKKLLRKLVIFFIVL